MGMRPKTRPTVHPNTTHTRLESFLPTSTPERPLCHTHLSPDASLHQNKLTCRSGSASGMRTAIGWPRNAGTVAMNDLKRCCLWTRLRGRVRETLARAPASALPAQPPRQDYPLGPSPRRHHKWSAAVCESLDSPILRATRTVRLQNRSRIDRRAPRRGVPDRRSIRSNCPQRGTSTPAPARRETRLRLPRRKSNMRAANSTAAS